MRFKQKLRSRQESNISASAYTNIRLLLDFSEGAGIRLCESVCSVLPMGMVRANRPSLHTVETPTPPFAMQSPIQSGIGITPIARMLWTIGPVSESAAVASVCDRRNQGKSPKTNGLWYYTNSS
jgi:hypothetical protein